MEVALTVEQRLFAQSADKLAADLASRWAGGRGPDSVGAPVPSQGDWQRIVDAGWLDLRVGEAAGGYAGTCVDVCVLAERLGYHAVPAPVLGTIVLAEQLRLAGSEPALLRAVTAGTRRCAPVLTADLTAFASSAAGAIALDSAGAASAVIVTAAAHEVRLGPSRAGVDLTRELAPVAEPESASSGTAGEAVGTAFALAVVAADLLGVMQAALDAAVRHAKVREQFGAPIGSFQAVQHLAAECLVSVEATRSAVWYAAWAVDELAPAESVPAARTAKAFASAAGVEVVEAAIQIFGGIGMTWEAPLHIWQRRAHLDRRLFGDEQAQYALLADI